MKPPLRRFLSITFRVPTALIKPNRFHSTTVKTTQAFLPRVNEWFHYRKFDFITRFNSPFFEWRVENSKQDSIQYSNFSWTNEQYSYTIIGTLSTRTSLVVSGKISKMADRTHIVQGKSMIKGRDILLLNFIVDLLKGGYFKLQKVRMGRRCLTRWGLKAWLIIAVIHST